LLRALEAVEWAWFTPPKTSRSGARSRSSSLTRGNEKEAGCGDAEQLPLMHVKLEN
jgi:hypothetical protein